MSASHSSLSRHSPSPPCARHRDKGMDSRPLEDEGGRTEESSRPISTDFFFFRRGFMSMLQVSVLKKFFVFF